MPTKQRFVVTALICFGMATIMSLIGNLLASGHFPELADLVAADGLGGFSL